MDAARSTRARFEYRGGTEAKGSGKGVYGNAIGRQPAAGQSRPGPVVRG
jgi:hypothetical protein